MNPINDIAEYLEDNVLGTVGTDIFLGNLPDDVDNAVMVDSTSGAMANQYYGLYHAQIEIWVRHKSALSGYDRLRDIFELLQRKSDLNLTGCYVYYLHPITDVEGLGRDSNGRSLHKILVDMTYREIIS